MNYSTGYAVNVNEMMINFKKSTLKITSNQCKEILSDHNRRKIVSKVFIQCVKLVVEDMIYNNATFRLPTKKEFILYLKPFTGEQFIRLRRRGRWQNVDFIETDYTGYQMTLKYKSGKLLLEKSVYLCPKYRDAIVEHINNGNMYHDANVKTIEDYIPALQEEFTYLCESDIRTIVKYMWRMIPRFTLRRQDIIISNKDLWLLIGYLRRNPIAHFNYYLRKLASKCRLFYMIKKTEWDGYYYFGLYKDELEEFKKGIGKRGAPKRWYYFNKKILFRVFDEANYKYSGAVAILRVKPVVYLGYSFYKPVIKCERPEIVLEREPLKFKDVLVTNNK